MNLEKILTGRTDEHIEYFDNKLGIHKDMIKDFMKLQEKALKNNITLKVASGYRNFDRQNLIWNEKLSGIRTIYDQEGLRPINIKEHSQEELIFYILRWSAIPGMSRHHWGTDIDVYDPSALSENGQLQLIPAEYDDGGPMMPLYNWLTEETMTSFKNKFYFPYIGHNKSSVAEEKWHLSYIPLASIYEEAYTYSFFIKYLEKSPICNKEIILENAETIYENYFRLYFSSIKN